MIDFKNCPIEEHWYIVDSKGKCKLLTNEIEFTYACLQIAKNNLEGYYLVKKDDFIKNPNNVKKYYINNNGVVENYPSDLFTINENLSVELLKIRFGIKN